MHKIFSALQGFKLFNTTGEINDEKHDNGDGALLDSWLDGDSYGDGQFGSYGDGRLYIINEAFDFSFNLKFEEEEE